MVIVYKTGKITYSIGKKLVKVNNIGMANIIAGEKIVPELIQNEANARNIYLECKKMLTDEGLYNHIRKRLSEIKEKLGTEGASQKAAAAIYKMI
jgi:lipid-A-disaccharide synthase